MSKKQKLEFTGISKNASLKAEPRFLQADPPQSYQAKRRVAGADSSNDRSESR